MIGVKKNDVEIILMTQRYILNVNSLFMCACTKCVSNVMLKTNPLFMCVCTQNVFRLCVVLDYTDVKNCSCVPTTPLTQQDEVTWDDE